mgnify:CR=1 FL=1
MCAVNVRSRDVVHELRVGIRNAVIVSRINSTQLERVRREWARLDSVRADARRLGLIEVACVPESYVPYPGPRQPLPGAVVSGRSARTMYDAQDIKELGVA